MSEHDVDVAILGAGTAGMAAYREVAKQTDSIALIDGGELGTTCARVGCMPSKLLIAAADAAHATRNTAQFGVHTGEVTIDGIAVMNRLRSERDRFVGFVKEAVDAFDVGRLIRQNAHFVDDHTLALTDGSQLTAKTVIIATGSRPILPPPFEVAGDRLIINDDVFGWQKLPRSVAVFGAGVIGLELGQALSRLGVRVHLFGRGNSVGSLSDPDIIAYARDTFMAEMNVHFDTDTTITRDGDEIVVNWINTHDASDTGEERFEYLLAATGRRPNLDRIGLENTSLVLDDRGIPQIDRMSMRTTSSANDLSPIFVTGDAAVERPLLHEAVDEGRIAGENAARYPEAFRRTRRIELGVVFSDPQIAIAGRGNKALTDAGVDFAFGEVSFEDQGRARVIGKNKGILRVYGERDTGLLLGAEMIGPAAEHLGHLLAWSIESKLTVDEVLQRPFYHPVIEEGLRSALRDLAATLQFAPNPPLRCIDCGPGS